MRCMNVKLGERQGNQGCIYKAGILILATTYIQHSDPDVDDTGVCTRI